MTKETFWYAHPLDANSNTIIAYFIGGGEDGMVRITCEDGETRDSWHLRNYADYRALSRNPAVRAEFFVRRGRNSLARPWPFPKREGNPERSGRVIGERLLAKARHRNKGVRCC